MQENGRVKNLLKDEKIENKFLFYFAFLERTFCSDDESDFFAFDIDFDSIKKIDKDTLRCIVKYRFQVVDRIFINQLIKVTY